MTTVMGVKQSYIDKVKCSSLVWSLCLFSSFFLETIISLLVPFLSFCPPEPCFYLEVTVLPKVFPHYCLEVSFLPRDICILMGAHTHMFNSLMGQGVRAAGYKVGATARSTLSSRNVMAPRIAEMLLVLKGERNSSLWSASDIC